MNLFKAKTADQLEERLMNVVNNFTHRFGLKDEVTTKVENAEKHIKLGTMGGLGIGAIGVIGGIVSIAAVPAIATTAVAAGLTVAGVAIAGGGAGLIAGLSYAGIGKLYAKYQESKLGDLTSKIFEKHRMGIEEAMFDRDFNKKLHKETDYKVSSDHTNLYNIKEAVKDGDMVRARGLVKEFVDSIADKADLRQIVQKAPVQKAPLFKAPVADDLNKNLSNFFDTYKRKVQGLENQDKMANAEHKMLGGVMFATAGAVIAGTGLIALGSMAVMGGGLALSAAALAYTGIKGIHKMVLSSKHDHELQNEADKYIQKASKDLNIDVKDLEKVKNHMDNLYKSPLKDDFVKETANTIKARQKIS